MLVWLSSNGHRDVAPPCCSRNQRNTTGGAGLVGVITFSNTLVHLSVKGSTECMNLLSVDVSFCRMECEVDLVKADAVNDPPPAE